MAATVPRYDVFSPAKPNEFYEYKTMSGVLPGRNELLNRQHPGRTKEDSISYEDQSRLSGRKIY